MAPTKKNAPTTPNPPKQNKSKKSKGKGKPKSSPSTSAMMFRPVPTTPATAGFTVSGATGGKEIVLRREFFHDIAGTSWFSFAARPDTDSLGASMIKRVQMFVLPPVINGPNSSNNVMVMAGAPGAEINTGTQIDIYGGTQTLVLPSNAPKMIKTLDVDFLKLKKAGVSVIGVTNNELVRFALISPDTGAFMPQATLQCKFVAYYAVTPSLTNSVVQQLGSLSQADSNPMPDGGVLRICYDTVVGLENSL